MSLRNLWIVCLLTAALLIGRIIMVLNQTPDFKSSTQLTPSSPTPSPPLKQNQNSNSNSLVSADSSTKKNEQVEVLNQSPSCVQNTKEPETLQISLDNYIRLINGQPAFLVFGSQPPCLLRNKKYPGQYFRRGLPERMIYETQNIKSIRVSEIKLVPKDKVYLELKGLPPEIIKNIISNHKNDLEKDQTFIVARLALDDTNVAQSSYLPSVHHPKAQSTPKEGLLTFSKSGTIIDVRPSALFKMGSIPKSQNIPAQNIEAISDRILSANQILKRNAGIPIDKLPTNKESPILIYSHSAADWLGYNTVTYLSHFGYKNLHWYRDGYLGFIGTYSAPSPLPYVTLIDAPQSLQLMQTKTEFLDTRREPFFKKGSVRGAKRIKLKSKADPMGNERFSPQQIAAAQLIDQGETLADIPQNKETQYILFGKNEFDNRPYKVAALMNRLGFRKIYILRGGWSEWSHFHLFYPGLYRTTESN